MDSQLNSFRIPLYINNKWITERLVSRTWKICRFQHLTVILTTGRKLLVVKFVTRILKISLVFCQYASLNSNPGYPQQTSWGYIGGYRDLKKNTFFEVKASDKSAVFFRRQRRMPSTVLIKHFRVWANFVNEYFRPSSSSQRATRQRFVDFLINQYITNTYPAASLFQRI